MHRIDAPGHDSNDFQGGDPTASPPKHATQIGYLWLKAINNEAANLVEKCGGTLGSSGVDDETETGYKSLVDHVGQSWVTFTTAATGGAVTNLDSRNASITRVSDGVYDVTWTNNYANASYCISLGVGWSGATATIVTVQYRDIAAGSVRILTFDASGSPFQANGMHVSVRATGTVS